MSLYEKDSEQTRKEDEAVFKTPSGSGGVGAGAGGRGSARVQKAKKLLRRLEKSSDTKGGKSEAREIEKKKTIWVAGLTP